MNYPYYGNPYMQPMQDNLAQLRQQQMQTMPPRMPVQTVQQQPMQTSVVWISGGKEEANGFMVAPNSRVIIFETNSMIFHIKERDASGTPIPMRTFNYVEETETVHQDTKIDDKFVTREEFNNLAALVGDLKGKKKRKVEEDEGDE
nr:MAG TPA: hypothetical protein [Caudoviricetes sp.]